MPKYEHSDRLSLFRLTQELEADQGISEEFDPERETDGRFAEAALKILEAEDPDSTHTICTAVSAVLNLWIINHDLPVYHKGALVTDPVALFSTPHKLIKESSSVADDGQPISRDCDIWSHMQFFEDRIFIRKEDFKVLCIRKKLPLPPFWFSGEQTCDPPAVQPDDANKTETVPCDPLAEIRLLKDVTPEEVCLEFVQKDLIQVKVRDVVVRVPLGELNLIDRRRGGLNSQGAILEHLTKVQILPRGEANRKRISRLREVFKTPLGITAEPFDCSQSGWSPRFKVIDRRHAQDERAKRSAKHVSLNENIPADDYPHEDEDDEAGRFIKDNTSHRR